MLKLWNLIEVLASSILSVVEWEQTWLSLPYYLNLMPCPLKKIQSQGFLKEKHRLSLKSGAFHVAEDHKSNRAMSDESPASCV